jgi:hypothetical protein
LIAHRGDRRDRRAWGRTPQAVSKLWIGEKPCYCGGVHRCWVARTPLRPGRAATRGDFRPAMSFTGRFWRGQRLKNSPSCSFGTLRQWPPGHPAWHDFPTPMNSETVSEASVNLHWSIITSGVPRTPTLLIVEMDPHLWKSVHNLQSLHAGSAKISGKIPPIMLRHSD